MTERRFQRPTVTNVSAKFATDRARRYESSSARPLWAFYPPYACVCTRGRGRRVEGGDGENAIFPARALTHHLILHELMRHVRHLGQSVSEPLGLCFPPLQGATPARIALYGTFQPEGEREIRSIPPVVGRRERVTYREMSTRKAPGSTISEARFVAVSTMSTRGSSYSLTVYPWEIIKMMAPAVLKVYVCQKCWICQDHTANSRRLSMTAR